MNNIICLAGPTASGKTALAVELAKDLNAEIISCDSMQIYKRMDIGTAKPTREEMQSIVHHMIDIIEPDETFSVSRYCDMATPILEDILSRGKTAIIAGGTGLYMDSLIRGNNFADFPDSGLRSQLEADLEEKGVEPLLERLRAVDPESAANSLSNPRRIVRALQVYYETGETISAHNARTQSLPPRYTPLWLGLDYEPRAALYDRVNRRVGLMLEMGLLNEIRSLLDSGIPKKCTAMQAIGYKEFIDAMDGFGTIEEAADLVRQSSRRYAKRQLTWFRRNPAMNWLRRTAATTDEEILQQARQVIFKTDK